MAACLVATKSRNEPGFRWPAPVPQGATLIVFNNTSGNLRFSDRSGLPRLWRAALCCSNQFVFRVFGVFSGKPLNFSPRILLGIDS